MPGAFAQFRFNLTFLITIILFGFTLCAVAAPARTTVRVRRETVAISDILTLGDLAVIEGAPNEVAALRAISLGYSPDIGVVRQIAKQKIALAISAAGFSEGKVVLDAPEVAFVKRESSEVDHTLIKDAVARAVASGARFEGASIRVSRLDLPVRIEIPAGEVAAEAFLASVRNPFSPFFISIELRVDGKAVRRFSTTAQLEAFAPVLVAARELPARVRLREGDFKTEVKQLQRDPASYLRGVSRLRGVSLARPLAKGEPITNDVLVPELVVRPGDFVRIEGESDAVKIVIQGEARAAGRIGDRVQVKNLQSGAMLQAVVIDEGSVRVRF